MIVFEVNSVLILAANIEEPPADNLIEQNQESSGECSLQSLT